VGSQFNEKHGKLGIGSAPDGILREGLPYQSDTEHVGQKAGVGKSVFGGLNGVATDIGFNYQWKDGKDKYKIKAGLAIRNIGSMTFKDDNNYNTNYSFTTQGRPPLDLSLFENINNLSEVEEVLFNNNYLNINNQNKTDFRVNLPTLLTMYADFKIVSKVFGNILKIWSLRTKIPASGLYEIGLTFNFFKGSLEVASVFVRKSSYS
jgi:hypothetical protein